MAQMEGGMPGSEGAANQTAQVLARGFGIDQAMCTKVIKKIRLKP